MNSSHIYCMDERDVSMYARVIWGLHGFVTDMVSNTGVNDA